MSKPVWKSGPPPSLGWWPASDCQYLPALRWWDGNVWSDVAFPESPLESIAKKAATPAPYQEMIEWRDRPAGWPARSRT